MPRPKGLPKTGGRKRGSKNKVTREIELARQGKLPLQYMLEVMRDPKAKIEHRLEMAKVAARYVHPRPASVNRKGNTVPTMIYTHPPLGEDNT